VQHPYSETVIGYDADAELQASQQGQIPLSVRIGVTGHRDIRDPAGAERAVRDTFEWLSTALDLPGVSQASPVSLQVCTPLAAGADQIVARALINLKLVGTGLIIPVLSSETGDKDYQESIRKDDPAALHYYLDQRHNDGRGDNKDCRQQNRVIGIGPGDADEAGFRKLGEWVVDHCDVLLALWDGRPAEASSGVPPGTAAIVSYALNHPRDIPVVVVPTARLSHPEETAGNLPPAQLLLRGEDSNPYKGLWLWACRALGGAPIGLSLVLGGHRDVLGLDDQAERQAEFLREVHSWPLDATGASALRRNAIGVSVKHSRRSNAPEVLRRMQRKARENIGFRGILDSPMADGQVDQEVRDAAERIQGWGAVRYQRVNYLASRYQQTLWRLDKSVYVLAATSVLVAAVRTTWTTQGSAAAFILSCLDVVILAAISAVLVLDLRGRYRDRWASFRAMAEYLRTYMFLALIEARRQMPADDDPASLTSLGLNEFIGPAWFARSMDVIWQQRPPPKRWDPAHLPSLKYMFRTWILDQESYHHKKTKRHTEAHRSFLVAVTSLFFLTLLAALVHIFASGRQFDDTLSFIAIAVPGFAAAINSIGASREHHRHAIRSRAAAHRLSSHYLPAISGAADIPELRDQAHELVRYMLGEATEWYEVMAVHSVDVPT
jgi:hypothetical protein